MSLKIKKRKRFENEKNYEKNKTKYFGVYLNLEYQHLLQIAFELRYKYHDQQYGIN